MRAILVLQDGTCFEGESLGQSGRAYGEVVFNTSMTGYQEILTDPSYKGQLVALTYPLIGNYGVYEDNAESGRIRAEALIVKECCRHPSHSLCTESLDDYLKRKGVVAIQGIDVRALTRKIRVHGVMMGALSTEETREEVLSRIQESPLYDTIDFVKQVSTPDFYQWDRDVTYSTGQWNFEYFSTRRVVAIDYGIKFNILRNLRRRGCEVLVAPCTASAEEIMAWHPDGVVLSNGPGDPALLDYAVKTTKGLLGRLPILGICLGNQILGVTLGGRTYKLKFGHRGANHPVKDFRTNRVYITSQNHGYAVDADSLTASGVEVSHMNLNDGTVEGLRHEALRVLSVQYHPEASPGPQDNAYIFDEFVNMMKQES